MSRHRSFHKACNWYQSGCLLGKHNSDPTPKQCSECMDYRGPSRGVGDKVASVLKAVKIDSLIKKKKGGCGCGKRRAALNQLMPAKDR